MSSSIVCRQGFLPTPCFFVVPPASSPCQGPAIQGSVILLVAQAVYFLAQAPKTHEHCLGNAAPSAMPFVVAAKPVKPVIISGFVESSPVLVLTCMGMRYNNSFDRHVMGDLRWAESESRLHRITNPRTRDWW